MKRKKLFISYGRNPAKFVNVIHRVKQDLEDKGYYVFIDSEGLKVQALWERILEEALEASDEIVFFMTEHAVRRPDGFCFNELAYAQLFGKAITPVMMELVAPPLSICRVQWLDMLNLWDINGELNEKNYQYNLNRLFSVLDGTTTLSTEYVQTSLIKLLEPVDFSLDIVKHYHDFVGRDWIYQKVNDWIKYENDSRIMWIAGEAGYGKTAIAANTTFIIPNVAGIFFCQYDSYLRKDPIALIKTFAYHLSTQIPAYKTKIENITEIDIVKYSKSVKDLFKWLILGPLLQVISDEKYVYVIDGLDEISEHKEIINLIATEFILLPSWLDIIITSRPEPELIRKLSKFTPIMLETKDNDNLTDIEILLKNQLNGITDEQIKIILAKSEGNMLYAREVVSEIKKHRLSLDNLDAFPIGLNEVYSQFFERQFPDIEKYKIKVRPLFELMIGSNIVLPFELICVILHWDEYIFEEIIEECGSLVVVKNGMVQFFHKSILEWLSDRSKCGSNYFISSVKGVEIFLNWIKNEYNSTFYESIVIMYKNAFQEDRKNTSIKILECLIEKESSSYYDLLNYISILKSNSEWEKARNIAQMHLTNTSFNGLQLAHLYYTIGRIYVDDITYFLEAEDYLLKSIDIYQQYNRGIDVAIVKNTLSIYYFSQGKYHDAQKVSDEILMYFDKAEDLEYIRNALESIHSNNFIYNSLNNPNFQSKNIQYLDKEIECYHLNNYALINMREDNLDMSKSLLLNALKCAVENKKYYAEAAISYNLWLLTNVQEFRKRAEHLVISMKYKIGEHILENSIYDGHVINTVKFNQKNYWFCVKNADILV